MRGEAHEAQLPAVLPGPSRRQAKVEPGSSAEKPNCDDVLLVVPLGPDVIVVVGGVVSPADGSPQVVPPSMR